MNNYDFKKWENDAFGFGYGTGEAVIVPLLRHFFDLLKDNDQYDY